MINIQAIERTKEFSSIVQRLITRSQIFGGSTFKNKLYKSNKFSEIEMFKKQANTLNNQIRETETKFSQMEALLLETIVDYAKISRLTEIIRTDLSDMSQEFTRLQGLLTGVNTSLSSHIQTRAHINGIAIHIQKRFQTLTRNFKDCVKKSNNNQAINAPANNIVRVNNYGGTHETSLSEAVRPLSLQRSAQIHDSEVRQRDKSVRDVEATIVQLGDVFEQFSTVLQEQEELIVSISKNASATFLNIDEAHTQLTKYFHSVKTHRALMIKFFIIVGVLIFIFTYFL